MLFIHISLIFLHLVTIYSHKNSLHLPQAALVYSPVNSFAITPIGRWHKIKKKQILISASFIGSPCWTRTNSSGIKLIVSAFDYAKSKTIVYAYS